MRAAARQCLIVKTGFIDNLKKRETEKSLFFDVY